MNDTEKYPGRHTLAYVVFVILSISIMAYALYYICFEASFLRPRVFRTDKQRRVFDKSGCHFDFDVRESQVLARWITTHQDGWMLGSSDDFDPHETQLLADNYIMEIDNKRIVFQYYKTEADLANDPSDGFIVIKRPLSADERSFWKEQISVIERDNQTGVPLYGNLSCKGQ